MFATTLVVPLTSVRRSVPLRAVCSTERSGRTASDIGSPTSLTPRASSICCQSAGLITVCASAVDAVNTTVAAAATNGTTAPAHSQRCTRIGRCLRTDRWG
jgi:hypothetical protein